VVLFYSVKYAPSDFVTAAQCIHETSSMLKHYPLRGNSFPKAMSNCEYIVSSSH
jgi:hypothetical protein